VSILSWAAWPWRVSACGLILLLIAARVVRWRDRREWVRDPVFQQHQVEWRQRAKVAQCVALGTCQPPYGCGDACGAERPRAEVAAGVRAVKGRHRA
jgi:hypothetical protein